MAMRDSQSFELVRVHLRHRRFSTVLTSGCDGFDVWNGESSSQDIGAILRKTRKNATLRSAFLSWSP